MLTQVKTERKYIPAPQTIRTYIKSAFRQKIYIVGYGPRATDVFNCLSDIPVERILIPGLEDVTRKVEASAIGVIFVGPMIGLKDAIDAFKSSDTLSGVPIHVASSDSIGDKAARDLYERGVSSVVAFPRERKIFTEMLCEMQKRGPNLNGKTQKNKRISKALWARANTIFDRPKKLKIWCYDGVVYFVGQLPSIAKKERLEKVIKAAPGVEKVIDSGIEIPLTESVDKELELKVDKAIEMTTNVASETLVHTVTNGNIVLAGNVRSRNSLNYLTERLRNIFGVRSLSNLASVSKKVSEKDYSLARKIKNNIEQFFIHSAVDVTIMKKVAFLKGNVNQRSKIGMIEELTLEHPAVSRVISKIVVKSS